MSLTPTPLYCSECDCQPIEAHKSYIDALRRILPIAVLSAIAFSGPVWAENPLGKMVYILESIVVVPIVAIRCDRAFVSRTILCTNGVVSCQMYRVA
jgi:hypothetical protein